MKFKLIVNLIFVLFVLLPVPAFAHKVIVFAWVEDGMIYTQSSFGSKRKAKNCQITFVDEKGVVRHTGTTDDQGEYALKLIENIDSDLIVNLEAGSGHKASWRLTHDELAATVDPENVAAAMEKKESIEQGPSIFKIAAGLGIIFFLAFAVKWIKRKKAAHD